MTRMARPRASLGTVALLAVLAITTGWNLPPVRPGVAMQEPDAAPVRGAIPEDPAAAGIARARLASEARARATAWASAWDARASQSTPVGAEPDPAPAEPPAEASALPGARTAGSRSTDGTAVASTFRGRNHFWIPSIGMSTEVVPFPCPRKRPPDNYMYRWGCAKANNVYILGHAYSVMKPLYNAYMSGRLHVGMVAVYADDSGRIRTYRVTEWRVVDPAEGVHWAIAAQPVPSMTLQTCVGKYSQWRLNVRLVATD
jgi:hypothetical protein